jgi:hypothetical protein
MIVLSQVPSLNIKRLMFLQPLRYVTNGRFHIIPVPTPVLVGVKLKEQKIWGCLSELPKIFDD